MRNNKPEKLKIIKRIFLFTLALALTNCQNDESSTNQEQSKIKTVSLNEAKAFLKASTSNPLAKSTTSKLDNLEFDKAALEKINGSNELLTVIPFATNNEFRNDRVLVVKIEDEIKSVIFSMQPEVNSVNGLFSGKIIIYSLEGNFINGYGAKDGIIEVQYLKDITKTSFTSKPGDGDNNGVIIINDYRKPVNAVNWDAIWGSAGSSMGWSPVGGSSGMSWDALGSGGGSSSTITAPTSAQIAAELVKKINSEKLNPCQSEVLEMLKKATNADIAAMFTKLGVGTIYTVTFYSETTIDQTPAATQRISKYNYKIQLSTDYAGATKLFRAGNILHELGHAFFMSINDDYSNTKPPNESVFNNYPVLFQGYVENKFPNMYDAHHLEMAKQYIDVIAQTLQEYNKSADPSGSVPYEVYTDLAWGGLIGTPVFDEKFKVGTPERLRVENRYAAEQTGNPIGYNTGQLQDVVGKPCN